LIRSEIIDGGGTKTSLRIDDEGAIGAVVHPHPPRDEVKSPDPFRQYFTNNGSNDMLVDGSITPVDFTINASSEYDVYVGTMSVIIADAAATLNKFGNLAALTNGVEIFWETQDKGVVQIHEGLKTNLDFMRLSGGEPAIGTGADSFKADLSGGGADAYLPMIDIQDIFGLQWGLRLRKGTTDKIVVRIKDNVSGMDQFDIIAYGITF
jgi:hypothetical protein